VKLRINLLLIP